MTDDFLMVDWDRSLVWNFVNRVELELSNCADFEKVAMNSLLPESYRNVVAILSRACNHSRVGLLMDDDEEYVAFMLIVDEDCIPFLLDGLSDVVVSVPAVYKVFYDTRVACSDVCSDVLTDFVGDVVIPDLNDNFESWLTFKYDV